MREFSSGVSICPNQIWGPFSAASPGQGPSSSSGHDPYFYNNNEPNNKKHKQFTSTCFMFE